MLSLMQRLRTRRAAREAEQIAERAAAKRRIREKRKAARAVKKTNLGGEAI